MGDNEHTREIIRLDTALAEARQEIERLRGVLERNANAKSCRGLGADGDPTLEIQCVLVLSTEHLKPDTRATLETLVPTSWEPQVRHPFGWDWYVPSAGADIGEYPDELGAVFALARTHRCTWVRFDGDGPVVAGLPRWDGDGPDRNTKGGR